VGDHPVFREVVAIIRPERWTATKARLERLPVTYTQCRVLGRRREGSLRYLPRTGTRPAAVHYLPQRMICCEVEESLLDAVLHAFQTDCLGRAGDGCVFVLPIQAVLPMEAEILLPVETVLPTLPLATGEALHAAG
jgi:nitrogen regulatory protein PII